MPQVEFEEDSRPAPTASPIARGPSAYSPHERPRARGMAGLLIRYGLASSERAANIELIAIAVIALIVALWPLVKNAQTSISGSHDMPPLDTLYTRYGPPPLHSR